MPLAFSYVRFSSKIQGKGDSLRRQTDSAIDFIASNPEFNLTFADDGQYLDAGVSAFRSKNKHMGALGQFISKTQDGSIPKGSWLLVENLDRLSRDEFSVAVTLLFDIVKTGITVATLTDGKIYNSENIKEIATTIQATMSLTLAYEESEKKSKRQKRLWEKKRTDLTLGKQIKAICPSWLQRAGDHFEIIPEKAAIVKKIFDLAEDGIPQSKIAIYLNTNRVPPFKESARGWKQSNVFHILSSRTVFGEFQTGISIYDDQQRRKTAKIGDPIPNYYPEIVSKAQFLNVERVRSESHMKSLHNNNRQTGIPNLFSSIAVCAICGGPMVIRSGTSHGANHRYLVCDYGKRGIPDVPCGSASWKYDDVEELVLRYMKGVDFEQCVAKATHSVTVTSQMEELARERMTLIDKHAESERLVANIYNQQISEEAPALIAMHRDRLVKLINEKEKISARITEIDTDIFQFNIQKSSIVTSKKAIEQLDTLDGIELDTARLLISNAIRSSVSKLKICTDKNTALTHQLKKAGWSSVEIQNLIAEEGNVLGYAKGVKGMIDKRKKSIAIEFKDQSVRYILGDDLMLEDGKAKVKMIAEALSNIESTFTEFEKSLSVEEN